MEIGIVVAWILLAAMVAAFAAWTGRRPLTWFGLSLLLSPAVGLVALGISTWGRSKSVVSDDG